LNIGRKMKLSKNILTTVFNQLMEINEQNIFKPDDYERSESRQSQRNGYYERDFTTRVGTLELNKCLEHVMVNLHRRVFERYQRNEKALAALQCLRCMFQAFRHVKFQRLLKSSVEKSVSKSLVSSLTEQLDPMVKEWPEPFTLRYELSLSDD